MIIRTFYDDSVVTDFYSDKPTVTDRSHKECHDIMSLVRHVLERNRGILPPVPPNEYFDTTLSSEEMESLLMKQKAIFDRLPATVRERYGNDFTNLEYVVAEHPELFAVHQSIIAPIEESEDLTDRNSLPPESKKNDDKEVKNDNLKD